LIGFAANEPDWTLVRDSKIKDYPSVKWKMLNQEKMGKYKREQYVINLRGCFLPITLEFSGSYP
jgi:ribosomal protein S12